MPGERVIEEIREIIRRLDHLEDGHEGSVSDTRKYFRGFLHSIGKQSWNDQFQKRRTALEVLSIETNSFAGFSKQRSS